jgi:hypothetical protein
VILKPLLPVVLGSRGAVQTAPQAKPGGTMSVLEFHQSTGGSEVKLFSFVVMVIWLVAVPATCKDKPKTYQTGKLLDMTVEDVSRRTAIIGGMAAPIPGRLYVFRIRLEDLVYVAEYKANKLSYKPDWVVNDPIELRLGNEAKMFLKRPDGKELEVVVVKKVRPE